MSSSTYKRKRSDVIKYQSLKEMKELDSNDEAFRLTSTKIMSIANMIVHSRKTPTFEEFMNWNEYEASFYLKLCKGYGVDYQHLEDDAADERMKKAQLIVDEYFAKMKMTQQETKDVDPLENDVYVTCDDVEEYNQKIKAIEEAEEKIKAIEEAEEAYDSPPGERSGPFTTGSYSTGNEPGRIPYHLYLLVKDAVEIIKSNDQEELNIAEQKIDFFCTYFHSHLPSGWEYNRDSAISIIESYGHVTTPKYDMTNYTPYVGDLDDYKYDVLTNLTEKEMAEVMSLIHSRKTPKFSGMWWAAIAFYFKLCYCFRIKYNDLEAATDDDVCLMNTGMDDGDACLMNMGKND